MSGSMSGRGNGATVEPLRHHQTKRAETDMLDLQPPAPHLDSTGQKNGAIVRQLVGYVGGAEATAALVRLCKVMRPHGNLFQPSLKLQEKSLIGAPCDQAPLSASAAGRARNGPSRGSRGRKGAAARYASNGGPSDVHRYPSGKGDLRRRSIVVECEHRLRNLCSSICSASPLN